MDKPWSRITSKSKEARVKGINAALLSAFFLGLAPIFGKQAINVGVAPLAVVAFRTLFATVLMFVVMALFQRKHLYIYPVGLAGCLLAGWINGLGSLFFYSALGRIGAGVGQLLYSLYPLFVALWMFLDHQPPTRLTTIRLAVAFPAVYLLIQAGNGTLDLVGVAQMLAASALYALHLPINQRVLYDIPAPTVTFYTLLAMSALVVPTYFFSGLGNTLPDHTRFWWPLVALTIVTFLSRITLFMGVKHLGGMQTAILGLGELVVTVLMAHWWLGEQMNWQQWIGGVLLAFSLLLVAFERQAPPKSGKGGWFSWLRPPVPVPPSDFPWQPGD